MSKAKKMAGSRYKADAWDEAAHMADVMAEADGTGRMPRKYLHAFADSLRLAAQIIRWRPRQPRPEDFVSYDRYVVAMDIYQAQVSQVATKRGKNAANARWDRMRETA